MSEPLRQIGISEVYSREGPHSGLHDLRVITVCCIGRANNLMHTEPVAGAYYSAEIARVLDAVEDVEHLVDVDAVLVHDELDDAGVEIAAAGAHGQTDQRREAHGGVDALAVVDGADGGAVAHVAGDELELFDGLAHQLGAAGGDIAVGGAVEAVAADAVVLVVLVGDGVHERLAGHGLVERGVEHGNHGHVAHDVAAGLDAGDVGGVVQGREGDARLNGGHNAVVDLHGFCELLTAVDDAVADGVDLLHGADNTVFGAGELLNDRGDGLGMGGHGDVLIEDGLAADQGGVLEVAVDADPLAQALGHDLFGLHVDELILERGAAGVDN